jgi:uracil phosphoribosyltransferase
MTLLNRLSRAETRQPEVDLICEALFDWLFSVVASQELITGQTSNETRMAEFTPAGVYTGEAIDPEQSAVVVDVARAGILPSSRFFRGLNLVLNPDRVRQDHIFMNRRTDAQGTVTGVNLSGSKIGGSTDGATIFLPDPMAATGSSISRVFRLYRDELGGDPRRVVAVHLIVTPEYLRRITSDFPKVRVYAIRLDRGLSDSTVLDTVPGERWEAEVGLNEHQYIVPGAGGLGEVLNNAWV